MKYILSEVKKYLLEVTNAYERCPHGPEVINPPPVLPSNAEPPSPADYLLPPVIVWDPLLQFPNILCGNLFCPKSCHTTNSVPLKAGKWKNCVGSKNEPRKIYGKDGIVLLVSRVYTCGDGHELIAHDPLVMDNIPPECLQFFLSHKSGITVELSRAVTVLANAGLNFTEIERNIAQEYYDAHWLKESKFRRQVECYMAEENGNGNNSNYVDIDAFPKCENWIELPSDDIIIGCFILHYEENRVFYVKRMCDLSAAHISADHTFKVAANIGIKLPDNKWVTQYDSLFCVLNEKGQVVAWQLTKGTSFDHVDSLLKALKIRLDNQHSILDAIYVDNCCHVRGKLERVFGTDVPVKLDLFHAIARITQKMSKKANHYMNRSCITDFGNIFRGDTDKEEQRKEKTPSPQQISENLNAFIKRWANVKHGEDEKVLTSAVLHEIECLKKHILSGCLSDIPPGAGSEKNENLHRNLKHIVSRSRLGVKSALALLTCFFYQWNERKENKFVKGVIPPISCYANPTIRCNPPVESFGIVSSTLLSDKVGQEISDGLAAHTDIFKMHSVLQSTSSSDNSQPLKQVITKCLNYMLVKEEITIMNNSRSINTRLIHLMPCTLTLFSNHKYPMAKDPQESRCSLERLLSEFNLKLHEHPTNIQQEDSFFFSVITSIKSLIDKLPSEEHDEIQAKLLSTKVTTDPEKMLMSMKQLRLEVSKEWAQNSSEYQKLLITSDLNFTEETENFRRNGYFIGQLGNLLAIASAKILQISIVIFSSLEHLPMIPVVPAEPSITSRCVLLGYDVVSSTYYSVEKSCTKLQSGSDSADLPSTSHTTLRDIESKHCNCGRGAAKKDVECKFCKQIVGGPPSRCLCYSNMKGCNHKCRCSNCDNPYGSSQNAKAIYPLTRVKNTSKLKGHKNQSDAKFLLESKITPLLGWNDLESMLFDCMVDHMIAEGIELGAHTCLSSYNQLRKMSYEEGIKSIFPKNIHQIQGKLMHVRKCASVFEAMYKKQIELNWFEK